MPSATKQTTAFTCHCICQRQHNTINRTMFTRECACAADEDASKREDATEAAEEGGKAARTPLQVLAADLAALWRHPVYTVTILGSSVYTGGVGMHALIKRMTQIKRFEGSFSCAHRGVWRWPRGNPAAAASCFVPH